LKHDLHTKFHYERKNFLKDNSSVSRKRGRPRTGDTQKARLKKYKAEWESVKAELQREKDMEDKEVEEMEMEMGE
jgi:hypothetical protein